MRYTDDRILLCPPKCASRTAEAMVIGEGIPGGVDGAARHARLRELPEAVRRGREVWCLTREPCSWYASWWMHMRRAPFAISRAHHPSVPDFRRALHDYCFAWRDERRGHLQVQADATLITPKVPLAILREQAHRRCGLWSFMMRWITEAQPLHWNDRVRWIFTGGNLLPGLQAAGFTLKQHPSRRLGGAPESLPRPVWDAEMRGWVEESDGATLRLIRNRMQ